MTGSNGDPGNGDRDSSGLPGEGRLKKIATSSGTPAGRAYQGAMESVFAIVAATALGYWADSHFGTSPRWLIVGAVVGFGAFVLRLARMAKLIEDPTQSDGEAIDGSEPSRRNEPNGHGEEDDGRA